MHDFSQLGIQKYSQFFKYADKRTTGIKIHGLRVVRLCMLSANREYKSIPVSLIPQTGGLHNYRVIEEKPWKQVKLEWWSSHARCILYLIFDENLRNQVKLEWWSGHARCNLYLVIEENLRNQVKINKSTSCADVKVTCNSAKSLNHR